MERKFNGIKKVLSDINSWNVNCDCWTAVAYDYANDKLLFTQIIGNDEVNWDNGHILIGIGKFNRNNGKWTIKELKNRLQAFVEVYEKYNETNCRIIESILGI